MSLNDVAEPREREEQAWSDYRVPLKRVRILPPFMCAHVGTQYLPNAIAEVPEAIADNWIQNQWAVSEEVKSEPVKETRKRGRRTEPE